MNARVQALYDERATLVKETRELLERCDDRPETPEERAEREKRDERFEQLNTQIDAWKTQYEREKREEELRETRREIPEADAPNPEADHSRARFVNWIRGRAGNVQEISTRDFSADSQNIGNDGDGGYLVPDEFERTLWKLADDENIMRGLATIRPTSSGTLTIPYRNTKPAASQEDEKETYTTGNIEFGTVTIDAHKIANSIPITEEMLDDSAFDIETEVTEALSETMAALEETWFVTGNGTKQAHGVVTGATAGVTAASATAITADELMELYHEPKQKYRRRSVWLMEDATILAIRKLKDGNQQYLWQPGLRAGEPDQLLGKPVIACEAMATIEAAAVPIIFGDMSYYRIADRRGLRLIRDPYSNATEGVVMFTASWRTGGRLVISEAVQKLTMAA